MTTQGGTLLLASCRASDASAALPVTAENVRKRTTNYPQFEYCKQQWQDRRLTAHLCEECRG